MYDDTPNTHDLFAKLRAEWLGKDGIRTNRALSERLGPPARPVGRTPLAL